MILCQGELLPNSRQDEVLAALPAQLAQALSAPPPEAETVIRACHRLSQRALAGEFDEVARPLLAFANLTLDTFRDYCRLFSADALRRKVATELGGVEAETPTLCRRRAPLGVLLHIAAGNVDVLPAYSVVEGLLAGNINLLKLPTGDSGLSVRLLSELIREEPTLRDHVYVFDVPSTEVATMRSLAELADGVAVWGGDAAVAAARSMISPNTKLIPWGHKLSFAYALPHTADALLLPLAEDICRTNQLLCSSCQGIFVDTEEHQELLDFGKRFFALLKRANAAMGKAPLGMRAKNALKLYNDRLEGVPELFSEDGVSVAVRSDSTLELSYLYRNVWIRPLPRRELVAQLHPHKGHLQTCGLLVEEREDRAELTELLIRAGITRITDGNLSGVREGEAHDGMLPLLAYSRVVDVALPK